MYRSGPNPTILVDSSSSLYKLNVNLQHSVRLSAFVATTVICVHMAKISYSGYIYHHFSKPRILFLVQKCCGEINTGSYVILT